MGEQISRDDLTSTAASLRAVLASIEAGELSCSAAYRNRLEGAVVALEGIAGGADSADTSEPPGSTA